MNDMMTLDSIDVLEDNDEKSPIFLVLSASVRFLVANFRLTKWKIHGIVTRGVGTLCNVVNDDMMIF